MWVCLCVCVRVCVCVCVEMLGVRGVVRGVVPCAYADSQVCHDKKDDKMLTVIVIVVVVCICCCCCYCCCWVLDTGYSVLCLLWFIWIRTISLGLCIQLYRCIHSLSLYCKVAGGGRGICFMLYLNSTFPDFDEPIEVGSLN